ncbi:MAG: phosphotransferase KptA/Tpt1 [Hyphomonadaceae bacterium]|nr:MAG: phosphotransferase KptA/Tpt1 [Hyphomonadaceae bacterium]
MISEVVRNNDKKRFTLSDDKRKIRAAQGHSINIDLGLKPSAPPDMLYHGTASKNLNAIAQLGLLPMSRDMVHLSSDEETALKVGSRHGKPIIIRVAAAQMAQDGHEFFRAENGVWLAKQVEAKYLRF